MKVIDAALKEIDPEPKRGWWGFFDGKKHYLMRYNHIMVTWIPGCVLTKFYETRTDKAGVMDAVSKIEKFKMQDFLPMYDMKFILNEQKRLVELEKYEEAAILQKEINSRLNRA